MRDRDDLMRTIESRSEGDLDDERVQRLLASQEVVQVSGGSDHNQTGGIYTMFSGGNEYLQSAFDYTQTGGEYTQSGGGYCQADGSYRQIVPSDTCC